VIDEGHDALAALAHALNDLARTVTEAEGEHVPMYFLVGDDGQIEPHLFEDEAEGDGSARGREMADAVRASDAQVLAFVAEAWEAAVEDVPDGGHVGEAPGARDVLLLVAIDSGGNTVALETPVMRADDGTVELGPSEQHGDEYAVGVLDPVRAVWAGED
jgi:hypothetical protein